MGARVETAIPGRQPIELVAFYEEFRWYYPQCELETKRWFVKNVQPEWWIFDVGANVGYYTILFAQLAHRGRVIAFEPTITAKMLRANLQHHSVQNAEVHEIALGAATGLRQDRIFRLWGTEGEEQAYQFSTLDDFVDQHKPARVDCVKIDVDSFDFDVLRGAERTLLRYDPVIVIELSGSALAKRNQYPSEPLAWLAQRGYRKALVLDHENFLLQRKGRPSSDIGEQEGIELVFPQPRRVDERLTDTAGPLIAAPFVKTATVVDGSMVRRTAPDTSASSRNGIVRRAASIWDQFRHKTEKELDERPSSDLPAELRSIIGVPIETSTTIWSWALVMELVSLPADRKLSVEITVEVREGKLGVALVGQDQSQPPSQERILAAMPGTQRVVLVAPTTEVRFVVFRTAAYDGTKTSFKLEAIDARLSVP